MSIKTLRVQIWKLTMPFLLSKPMLGEQKKTLVSHNNCTRGEWFKGLFARFHTTTIALPLQLVARNFVRLKYDFNVEINICLLFNYYPTRQWSNRCFKGHQSHKYSVLYFSFCLSRTIHDIANNTTTGWLTVVNQ